MGCCNCIQPTEATSYPKYILHSELSILLESPSAGLNEYVIIDLRDESMDYDGGHIHGSVHISNKIFLNKISEIFLNYNTKNKVIFCDMYGSIAGRSILCSHHYSNCRQQIVANYSHKTELSYYYINSTNEENDEKNDENNKRRIDINCDQEMITNLARQEVLVLKGGVFELINSSFANIIQNFDTAKWEQLELSALYGNKRWYHKNENFCQA
eukprot:UN02802